MSTIASAPKQTQPKPPPTFAEVYKKVNDANASPKQDFGTVVKDTLIWSIPTAMLGAAITHGEQKAIIQELKKKHTFLKDSPISDEFTSYLGAFGNELLGHAIKGIWGGGFIALLTNSRRQKEDRVRADLLELQEARHRGKLLHDLEITKRSPWWNMGIVQLPNLFTLLVSPPLAIVNAGVTALMYKGVFKNDKERNKKIEKAMDAVERYTPTSTNA